MEEIKEFIVDYIQREYTLPADMDVMELNYIESGYIDSLGFVQFVALIEEEFDIEIPDEDAEKLAELVRGIAEPKELIIAMHEPYTGIHVGPGMLSLFFLGAGR